MKRRSLGRNFPLWTMLAMTTMLAMACNKDEINNVSPGNDDVIDSIIIDDGDYDRIVQVVFSTSGDATVTGTGDSVSATVNGNDVTVTNTSAKKVMYHVSGSTTDGYLKIYSGRKQGITLNDASIKNTRGAAINVQGLSSTPNKGKRVDVVLKGSSTLADGANYTLTPSTEDEKAALFSEGQIVVSGEGALAVTATGKAGITSDDWVCFASGSINVSSSAGHGVRGKDYILVKGGTVNVNVSAAGKKGFSSDSLVRFEGGATTLAITGNTVVTTEDGVRDTSGTAGVKADQLFEMIDGTLTITNSGMGGKGISCDGAAYFRGGEVNITVTGSNFGSSSGGGHGPGGGPGGSSRDNSVGAKGIKVDGNIEISGGVITVKASSHEGIETKGTLTVTGGEVYSQSSDEAINSASTMTISGGVVCAYSTGNDALDANGNCYIQGGVVYAIGNLENGAQLTQSCYQASSWTKNVWYSITVGDNTYAFKTPSSGGTKLVVSGAQQPTVKKSVTVSGGTEMCNGMLVAGPEVSGGSNVSLTNYSGSGW